LLPPNPLLRKEGEFFAPSPYEGEGWGGVIVILLRETFAHSPGSRAHLPFFHRQAGISRNFGEPSAKFRALATDFGKPRYHA